MATRRGKKSRAWQIVTMIVIVLLCAAVIGLSVALSNRITTKTLGTLSYEIGALDTATGEEADGETTIRTRSYWETDGLTVTVSEGTEETTMTYQLFFYDTDKTFLSVTESYAAEYDGVIPDGAVYFKLLITPNTTEGEEAATLSWSDVSGYTGQITVTVNR